MRRLPALALALLAAGCSKPQPVAPTPPSQSAPVTPAPPAPPPPPANIVFTGHVVATVTGEPLAGVTLDLEGHATTTDSSGAFRYELAPGSVSATPALHLTGSNILPRDTAVTLSKSRDLSVDAISLSGPFNLGFYRQFVRDAFESPGAMRALRRWTVAPKVYVRTVDEAGKPIETPTIDLVRTVLAEDQSVWTGGRFGIASVDAGTQTREGVPGWITVKFPSEVDPHVCGRAQVAQSGGWIELDYKNNECTCHGPSRIDAIVVRHELGHAFGFYHTGDRRDLMSGLPWDCSVRLTAREQFHASVAYTREPGNADQDVDAATATLSVAPAPIVVN